MNIDNTFSVSSAAGKDNELWWRNPNEPDIILLMTDLCNNKLQRKMFMRSMIWKKYLRANLAQTEQKKVWSRTYENKITTLKNRMTWYIFFDEYPDRNKELLF